MLRILSHFALERLGRIERELDDVSLTEVPLQGDLPEDAQGEVLVTLPWGSPTLPRVLERGIRWVHTVGTGVDRFPLDAIGDRVLTCSRGASAVPISEWVLAMLLAFEKRLPETWISEPPESWHVGADLGGLEGRVLGLVGLGSIGTAVARRALAFGVRVRACRRTDAPSSLEGVEIASLESVLEEADHLVVAAPATPATAHLIDEAALARIKPGVHFVNVARGSLVDHDALRRALDAGRVARASLDTVDPEPLPPGHWLFTHPRVRLSAHVSWSAPDAFDRFLEVFLENLRRYRAGEPLLGRVDVAQGY